jgi:hypothetical protein
MSDHSDNFPFYRISGFNLHCLKVYTVRVIGSMVFSVYFLGKAKTKSSKRVIR